MANIAEVAARGAGNSGTAQMEEECIIISWVVLVCRLLPVWTACWRHSTIMPFCCQNSRIFFSSSSEQYSAAKSKFDSGLAANTNPHLRANTPNSKQKNLGAWISRMRKTNAIAPLSPSFRFVFSASPKPYMQFDWSVTISACWLFKYQHHWRGIMRWKKPIFWKFWL